MYGRGVLRLDSDMTIANQHPAGGITRRSWSGLLLVWVVVSLPFLFLYATSRRVVLNEIRNHATGVAIAAAAGLSVEDLEAVRRPEDVDSAAYRRTQAMLARLIRTNPDIRYIYTMRRSSQPFAGTYAFEFVVDQPARDHNGDGRIAIDEISEPPGKPYDARSLPALQQAWDAPGADPDITADPPYPDLISGYAPIRNADGDTVAIVGVDVTAATVRHKLVALQVVIGLVWLIVCSLTTLVITLYYQQRDASERNKQLNEELAARNDMLRKANEELAGFNREARRDWANHQVEGEPVVEPAARTLFDTYYLGCAMAGGDLVQVFDLDQDHVGFYLADTAEHGVREALVAGLLKVAVVPGRDAGAASSGTVYADLHRPAAVLATVQELLAKELPAGERVAFAYGVIDFVAGLLRVSVAGLPSPLRYVPGLKRLEELPCQMRPPLGGTEACDYPEAAVPLADGDRLILRTRPGSATIRARLERVLAEQTPRSCVDTAAYLQATLLAEVAAAAPRSAGSILVLEMR